MWEFDMINSGVIHTMYWYAQVSLIVTTLMHHSCDFMECVNRSIVVIILRKAQPTRNDVTL